MSNCRVASFQHIYFLGICVVFFGSLTEWVGLSAGFWTFMFSNIFMGSGYVCLCLCLAEMSSLFPFS
eukprot:gene18267-25703_t